MTARMRHGLVTAVDTGTYSATVTLDGVDVTAAYTRGGAPTVGQVATLVQDGRRLVVVSLSTVETYYAASFVFTWTRVSGSSYGWDCTDPNGVTWSIEQLPTSAAATVWHVSNTPFVLPSAAWTPSDAGSVVTTDHVRSDYILPPSRPVAGTVNTGQSQSQSLYTVTCPGSVGFDVALFFVGGPLTSFTTSITGGTYQGVFAYTHSNTNQVLAYTVTHDPATTAALTLDWAPDRRYGIGHRLAWTA